MLLWAAIGILGVAAQGAVSFFRKPEWVSKSESLDKNWRRVALNSAAAGFLLIVLDLAIVEINGFNGFSMVLVGVIGYVVYQSFVTDLKLRYVDRWIMRIANAFALGLAIYLMLTYGTEAEIVVFVIFAIVATGIIFLPGIGDSDGRAFQLMVFSLIPLYGIDGISFALIGMLASLIIYYTAHSIYTKEWAFSKLFTKTSFPMVPLILTPVLFILLFGRWLPGL